MTNFCKECKKTNKYLRGVTCLIKPDMRNKCTELNQGGYYGGIIPPFKSPLTIKGMLEEINENKELL